MLEALFTYQFLQNAVFASLLASVVCGVIGVIVVEKKLLMMSGGVAHTAYGGVGLGYLCGFEPIWGAAFFALLAAFGLGALRRRGGALTDVAVALLWSLGMALGIAFIGLAPGYPPDMSSYLFGNILTVTRQDIVMMCVLAAAVLLLTLLFFSDWKAYLFDAEFAYIRGLNTAFLEYLLLVMIALSVVLLLRVSGIMLVIALLSAPAATAGLFTKRLAPRMLLAALLSALFSLAGLALSYVCNIASGAAIVGVSTLAFALCFALTRLRRRGA